MHWFELTLKNPDRMTTKSQWKAISRWLRIVRNEIEKKIDYNEINRHLINTTVYGTNVFVNP